jgi:prophage regulatory protein
MPPTRILRRPAVEDATGLSTSTLYAMMKEGRFPRPLLIGKRAVGWPENVIHDWIESRTEAQS